MSDKDNRIRLDMPIVDFGLAGETGELHDKYPKPKTQARYDLMRSFLIGLLSNQSSDEEVDGAPFEKRTGTLWFKKKAKLLEIFNGEEFQDLSKYIGITVNDEKVSLESVILKMLLGLQYSAPRVIWCGRFVYGSENINNIVIPEAYQGYAAIEKMHPMVYVDGQLIDPRDTVIQVGSPSYVKINGNFNPKSNQRYTVILEHVTDITQEDIIGQG